MSGELTGLDHSLEEVLQPPLLVFEYGGGPRGGKGTLVKHIAALRPGIATEETGGDFRAVTAAMLDSGQLDPDMPDATILATVEATEIGSLAEMVAARPYYEATHEDDCLHTEVIDQVVPILSPVPKVRQAVKAGFTARVKQVRDDDEHEILLVDGRNLAPVIEAIAGTRLVMRTFVNCSLDEAAQRDYSAWAKKNRIDHLDTEKLQEIRDRLEQRIIRDAVRKEDPVRADEGALDFWVVRKGLIRQNGQRYSDGLIGEQAGRQNRQILFDTTPYRRHYANPVEDMVQHADAMFLGGLRVERGRLVAEANGRSLGSNVVSFAGRHSASRR